MKLKDNASRISVLFAAALLTVVLCSSLVANAEPKSINQRGDVVWFGHDGHDWEIFLYSKGTITQITDNDYDDDLVW